MFDYKIYLKDILYAIKRIEKSTKDFNLSELEERSDLWDSILLKLQIIGESIKNIPENIKCKYPFIEWRKMSRLRDIISHSYFSINKDFVIEILEKEIPLLKKGIRKIYYSKI